MRNSHKIFCISFGKPFVTGTVFTHIHTDLDSCFRDCLDAFGFRVPTKNNAKKHDPFVVLHNFSPVFSPCVPLFWEKTTLRRIGFGVPERQGTHIELLFVLIEVSAPNKWDRLYKSKVGY